MLRFVSRRLLQVIFTLLLLTLLAFAWWQSLPGDPAGQLDAGRPPTVQYVRFLARLVAGDLGTSTGSGRPVLAEIGRALPATAGLVVTALAIAVGLGVPLGYLAARHHGGPIGIATLVGAAMPVLALGYALRPAFALRPAWLPSVLVPALALAAVPLATIVRTSRGSVRDLLGSDVARLAGGAARTHGRYVLHAALRPFSTGVGLPAGMLLTGVVLTEKVFGWGGLGSLFAGAITSRDYPLLEALLVLGAVAYVVLSLFADVATALLDPRVRQS